MVNKAFSSWKFNDIEWIGIPTNPGDFGYLKDKSQTDTEMLLTPDKYWQAGTWQCLAATGRQELNCNIYVAWLVVQQEKTFVRCDGASGKEELAETQHTTQRSREGGRGGISFGPGCAFKMNPATASQDHQDTCGGKLNQPREY